MVIWDLLARCAPTAEAVGELQTQAGGEDPLDSQNLN
jgi:hypothetical protein